MFSFKSRSAGMNKIQRLPGFFMNLRQIITPHFNDENGKYATYKMPRVRYNQLDRYPIESTGYTNGEDALITFNIYGKCLI